MNRIFPSSSGTNVSGNWKSKAAQRIKSSKNFFKKKVIPSATKNYKSYVKPTVGMVRGAAGLAAGVGGLILKHPVLSTAAYIASKGFKSKGKFAKGRKFNQFGTAGKVLSKSGKRFV